MEHSGHAGLFPISCFAQLSAVDVAVAHDASSEITIYGLLHPDRLAGLAEVLNQSGDAGPTMQEVLDVAETFVDITQIRDLYSTGASRLVVRSAHDLSDYLRAVSSTANRAWRHYRANAAHLRTWTDFHQAITELTAPVLEAAEN